MKTMLTFIVLVCSVLQLHSQTSFEWANKKSINKVPQTEKFYKIKINSLTGEKWTLSDKGLYKILNLDSILIFFNDQNSPINYNCQNVQIDSKGNIWVGGYSELHKYDGTKWTSYYSFINNFPEGKIIDIEFDENDNLWFVISKKAVVKFDGNNFNPITTQTSNIPSNNPIDIAFDNNGKLWVITSDKTISFQENETFKNFIEVQKDVPLPAMKQMTFDNNNNVVIGTYYDGVVIFDPLQEKFTITHPDIDSSIITDLLFHNGIGWITTYKGNILKLQNNVWKNTYANSMIESNYAQFNSFDFENNNTIWFTSLNNGLFKLTFIDSTKSLSISKTINGSKNETDKIETHIYPNPASKQINITASLPDETDVTISLFDINGKNIKSVFIPMHSPSIPIVFNIPEVTSGVYFISYETQKYYSTSKIIVIK